MYITGLGLATPPRRFSQKECWGALTRSVQFGQLSRRSQSLLERVLLGKNGIESRFLAVEDLGEMFDLTPDALHTRFSRSAPRLAADAGYRALENAGIDAKSVDGVIVSTCTGYLCPGLTSYVIEALGLESRVTALDLVGQGCGAALPNMRTGEALLHSGQCKNVLSICVEVCSAAFYLDEDPGVLISACLFGDAAGAAVLSRRPHKRTQVRWRASASTTNPKRRDLLRFETRHGMLRNILNKRVPYVAAEEAERLLNELLRETGLKRDTICTWIWHAGGRDVLLALQKRLGLSEGDVRWSASVLAECGNVSSPFVYHALDRALRGGASAGTWLLSSFGAGFSCHGALLDISRNENEAD